MSEVVCCLPFGAVGEPGTDTLPRFSLAVSCLRVRMEASGVSYYRRIPSYRY